MRLDAPRFSQRKSPAEAGLLRLAEDAAAQYFETTGAPIMSNL